MISNNYLTHREREILFYWCKDLTDKEIANILFISIYTFRSHIKNIYNKLGVSKRHLAVLKAIELGIYKNGDENTTNR